MNETSHDPTSDIGWGTPSPTGPTTPVPTAAPTAPSGWTLLRRALLWAVLVLAVAGIGLGLYVVAEDMAETSDMFHGLGIALGLALAVPCLALCVVAGFGLRSMARLGAEGGRPHAVVVGSLLLILLLLVGLSALVLLPALLGAALIVSVVVERSRCP